MTTARLARRERVTTQTVRRWTEGGRHQRLERTPGGHCRVRVPVDPDTFLCARVSGARQESSLDTQERLLRDRCPDGHVVRDAGSGIDCKRRCPVALLERALRGDAVQMVAAAPDHVAWPVRLPARDVIELQGGSVGLLEENDLSDQFDVRCLVAYITSFCNAHHGKRSGQRHKKDQGLPEESGPAA